MMKIALDTLLSRRWSSEEVEGGLVEGGGGVGDYTQRLRDVKQVALKITKPQQLRLFPISTKILQTILKEHFYIFRNDSVRP